MTWRATVLVLVGAAALGGAPAPAVAWTEDWHRLSEHALLDESGQDWLINGELRVQLQGGAKAAVRQVPGQGVAAVNAASLHSGAQSLSASVASSLEGAAGGIGLFLCADQPAPHGVGLPYNGYAFFLDSRHGARIYKVLKGRALPLGPASPGTPARWGRFVLNAAKSGDRLSLSLDGKVVAQARDAAFQGGHAGFGLGAAVGTGEGGRFSALTLTAASSLDARPTLFLAQGTILAPSQAWEQDAVYEPCPIRDGDGYRMSYSGGWGNGGSVGIALSKDGLHWTKAGQAPVLGHGAGGELGRATRSSLVKVNGGYRLYYADQRGDLRLALSPDGLHFSRQARPAVDRDAMPGLRGWANQGLIQERGAWWMLLEGEHAQAQGPFADGGDWRLHLFKSRDGGMTFVPVAQQPLESLRVGYGTYSCPRSIFKLNGRYHIWYHVAESESLLPSVIWHAVSDDLRHWSPDPYRSLGVQGWSLGLQAPDQVADAALLAETDRVLLFYDADDNQHGAARIGLGLRQGSLKDLTAQLPDAKARRQYFPSATEAP